MQGGIFFLNHCNLEVLKHITFLEQVAEHFLFVTDRWEKQMTIEVVKKYVILVAML